MRVWKRIATELTLGSFNTYRDYRLALKVDNPLDDRYFTGGWNCDRINPGARATSA